MRRATENTATVTNVNDLNKLTPPPPEGWTSGVQWDGESGEVTTPPIPEGQEVDWEDVLSVFGLSPDTHMIDGPVRFSVWDVPGHGLQRAYRARVVIKPERAFEVDDLLDEIYLDEINPPTTTGQYWLTLQIGDTHIGKGVDDGGGTQAICNQWKTSVTRALQGFNGAGIHLAFLGDLIEGIVSNDGKNVTGNDLSLTEQLRVARHMVNWTILEAMEHTTNIVISAVPGNHGDTTRSFKTNMTDSYDIDIVAAAKQAFDLAHGKMAHVEWYFPERKDGYVTYQVGDTTFTSIHGHLFKGQPIEGARKWWSGLSFNKRPPASSQILMSGHYHHLQVVNLTADKWLMFSPSLETESNWLVQKDGSSARPGILAYKTIDGYPYGISVV